MSNIKSTTKAIKRYNLDQPTQMVVMSKILKKYIVDNNLYAPIAGRNYVMVEGWQFAGGLLGFFPRVVSVENIGDKTEVKWMAKVEIINTRDGSVASTGFALCSKAEMKKRSFDEYAILSMAQTRAIGKAFRNLIGWVMKLSGYEATPAEEMKPGVVTASTIPPAPQKPGSQAPLIQTKKVDELKEMLKGTTDLQKLEDIKKRTGLQLNDFKITERHAGIVIASLLNSEVK